MKSFSTALLLALAIGGLAACNSGGQGPFGSANAPYPLEVATSSTFNFMPDSVTYFAFTPSTTENHTIALTDPKSSMFWEIVTPNYPAAGSVQDCNFSAGIIDQVCDTPVLETGTAYSFFVVERTGVVASGEVTVSAGATPTVLTVGGGTVSGSMGSNGSLHYTFTPGATAQHTVHLTNLDSRMRVSIYTDGSYPLPGPDAGQCIQTSVTASFDCVANDGANLTSGTPYFLLIENINFSYADAGANAFDIEVTSP